METREDRSFGVIPIFKNDTGDNYFCLVREEDGHWGFPKGHQEEGESEEGTARRELAEETGINAGHILSGKVFVEKYSFERGGFRYDKSVKYFVCFVSTMSTETQANFKKEIPELRWLTYEEAKKLLTFPEATEVLNQVYKHI